MDIIQSQRSFPNARPSLKDLEGSWTNSATKAVEYQYKPWSWRCGHGQRPCQVAEMNDMAPALARFFLGNRSPEETDLSWCFTVFHGRPKTMCLTKIKDSDGTLGFWFTQSLGANTFNVRMDEGNSGKVWPKSPMMVGQVFRGIFWGILSIHRQMYYSFFSSSWTTVVEYGCVWKWDILSTPKTGIYCKWGKVMIHPHVLRFSLNFQTLWFEERLKMTSEPKPWWCLKAHVRPALASTYPVDCPARMLC